MCVHIQAHHVAGGGPRLTLPLTTHDTFLFKLSVPVSRVILRQVQLSGELYSGSQWEQITSSSAKRTYPLRPIERTGPCYPPVRSAYYFPYRTRVFFKHRKGDENASNEPPQTVARTCCQLSAVTTRTSNCYTAVHCRVVATLNNRIECVFCTLAPLILDGSDTIPSRHKRHTQHHEPKLQITYPCTVVISQPPAPGTKKSFFSIYILHNYYIHEILTLWIMIPFITVQSWEIFNLNGAKGRPRKHRIAQFESFDPLRTRFGPQLRGQPPQLPWQSRVWRIKLELSDPIFAGELLKNAVKKLI